MRVLVVGAGRTGARVLRQLMKNDRLEIVTLDPRQEPYAVQAGIIPAVDIHETLTPLTLEFIMEQAYPDLVLLTTAAEDLALGKAPGLGILAAALQEEVAALCEVPVIIVARTGE